MFWTNNKGERTGDIRVAQTWKEMGYEVMQFTLILGMGMFHESKF